MENVGSALRHTQILSLMPTRQCTASCSNCGTFSSPRAKVRLEDSVITSAIEQCKSAGFEVVVFTGGEATLIGPALLKHIAFCRSTGLVTRLVTNGHWAGTKFKSEQFVANLKSAGLNEINFSTGDEHVRFVALENVVRGAVQTCKAGITTAIMVELTKRRTITRASIENHPVFLEATAQDGVPAILINESPWMSMDPNECIEYPPGVAVDKSNVHLRRGCDSVLSTLTVEADGAAYACCGLGMTLIPELHIGDIRADGVNTLTEKANNDFLKHWINVEGPERILAWAASVDSDIKWEGMYAHRCQACLRLYKDPAVRKVILEHSQEVIPDVIFLEWLLQRMILPADVSINPA